MRPAHERPALIGPRVLLTGAAAVGLLGAPALLTRALSHGRIFTLEGVPHREVGLVLGAQVYPNGRPCHYLRARLDVARALYERGQVDRLIVSGDNSPAHFHEPDAMRRHLVAAGVPAEAIEVDAHGLDTYDSALRARQVFGLARITVISQQYHLPRTIATCRLLGVDAVGVGDTTMRRYGSWRRGWLREIPAAIKMVGEVAVRRRASGT